MRPTATLFLLVTGGVISVVPQPTAPYHKDAAVNNALAANKTHANAHPTHKPQPKLSDPLLHTDKSNPLMGKPKDFVLFSYMLVKQLFYFIVYTRIIPLG
jgi:hypothetical protein